MYLEWMKEHDIFFSLERSQRTVIIYIYINMTERQVVGIFTLIFNQVAFIYIILYF